MRLDFEEIKELIPQRFPYIMIDRVTEVDPGREAVSVKNVSGNDIFFLGHFPEKAIMPGTAIVEAMAQTAIVIFTAGRKGEKGAKKPLYYLGSVKARFLRPVVPGDRLEIRAVNVRAMAAGAFVKAEAFVEGEKVSEAEIVFSVKDE
ncbi:MAG: 3-hydroxyacyl-ACP dehydratase FabZ [Thermodesulfovibrionales bacterium]